MIDKKSITESMLTQMFYHKQMYERLTEEINQIYDQMSGLRSPNLTDIRGTPEDRQHKLIRLGAKIELLDTDRKQHDIEYKHLYQILNIYSLSTDDYRFISLLYEKRMTCDEVADKYGYNNGKYVSRKRIKLLKKIGSNIR